MSTFYLIRHATNDLVGNLLPGWMPGLSLNAEGHEQAERLAWTLLGRGITRIYSSPLERALETAAPIAKALDLKVEVRDGLGEVRTGKWTGRRIDELEHDPLWRRFLAFPSGSRAPGGESLAEVQARMVAELECLQARHPAETVAVVSHADPIRAALAFFAGIPADFWQRLEISPASFSILALDERAARILKLNETAA